MKRTRILLFCLVLALALFTASAAYAASIFIITTNGEVDDNWGPVFVADGDDGVALGYEIIDVYVAKYNGTPNEIAFRADMEGQLSGAAFASIRAYLDCDGGGFTGSGDIIIEYLRPPLDLLFVSNPGGTEDLLPGQWGEEIENPALSGNYTYEWKAPMGDAVALPNVDWTDCLTNPNVPIYFGAFDGATDVDVTTVRNYDIPTAIELTNLTAASSGRISTAVLLGAGGLAGMAALALIWRRRKSW